MVIVMAAGVDGLVKFFLEVANQYNELYGILDDGISVGSGRIERVFDPKLFA